MHETCHVVSETEADRLLLRWFRIRGRGGAGSRCCLGSCLGHVALDGIWAGARGGVRGGGVWPNGCRIALLGGQQAEWTWKLASGGVAGGMDSVPSLLVWCMWDLVMEQMLPSPAMPSAAT